jgi:hypothetical protein
MRSVRHALAATLAMSLALASVPTMAAGSSADRPGKPGSPIASVGSRIDGTPTVTSPRVGPPAGLPWQPLDEAVYARAKAIARQRAADARAVTAKTRSDFAISASPSTQSVVQGSSVRYTVNTQALTGSPRPVGLTVSALPSGASATFDPASVSAGQSSVMTVATTAAATTGTFTLTITGTYASPPATHSTTVSLTVTAASVPPSDFSIGATPASQTVAQGSSTMYTIGTQVTSGSAQTINLIVAGLASGATATFNPPAVTAGQSSVMNVVISATATTGTFMLTITGVSPVATHSTAVSLTVTALPPNDFSLAASPPSQTITQGASTSYTVTTAVASGSPETVNLSISGLGSGATGTFAPAAVTAGQSSLLTVATATAAATGTFVLTITGVSPSATHSVVVSLSVNAPPSGPSLVASWLGESENDLAPPDPTGAIGPNSYIELINLRYGIFGRDGSLINNGDLGALTLFPLNELSDPQVVWDPTAQRFYYLVLDFYSSAYAFGYSKTADPRSADDFCHYDVGAFYSSLYLPDYPKLAVTQDFVLVGTNVFLLASFYTGSDVDWFQKPTDPACPAQLGGGGIFGSLKNADGSATSTPEPAVSADATSGGWIVGSADVGTGSASFLTLFKVTTNASGSAVITAPMRIGVSSYSMPDNAPQPGATVLIDTMDTRLTHAVAGYDPRIGVTGVWTAHTVFGGAGAEDRWYEISTAGTPQVSQSGKVSDPSLYVWNGAISPDRAADDTTDATALTGRNMVMGFNTSSSSAYVALQMVSQRSTGAQSGSVLVKQSVGPYVDFACTNGTTGNVCRWGDYGGATPDPSRSFGGQVWLSGEWNNPATDGVTPTWQTWNWGAKP